MITGYNTFQKARCNRSYRTFRPATLESEGFLVRTHGGGSLAIQTNETNETNRETKSAMHKKASLINDGETVIVTAGTTTALIAKYLTGKKMCTLLQ